MVLRLIHANYYTRDRKLRPVYREFREPRCILEREIDAKARDIVADEPTRIRRIVRRGKGTSPDSFALFFHSLGISWHRSDRCPAACTAAPPRSPTHSFCSCTSQILASARHLLMRESNTMPAKRRAST